MDIKKKANWLRGFLESLMNSDNISKKQIEVLLAKIEELVIDIEEDEENDDHENKEEEADDAENEGRGDNIKRTSNDWDTAVADDLPF